MNKHKVARLRVLELKKETLAELIVLDEDQLKQVAGGNTSTRKSQCPTLCFT